MITPPTAPAQVRTEEELDALLARPYPELVEMMRRLDGDLAILGVAGKMGLTLAAAAANAVRESATPRRIYGVSRFTDGAAMAVLERLGIVPLRCDLLDRAAVGALPAVPNVVFMAGRKFGTAGAEELTWAVNTLAAANVCEHFAAGRIVAFSTGCVYPLVPPARGGCTEADRPDPAGEYAQSCLGRERLFRHFSSDRGTPVCLIRLNYALDLRYGVLHDLARAVWEGRPVSRAVDAFNAIWQGDACNQALLALELCSSPADIINLTGPETASVTRVAREMGALLGRPVEFSGAPGNLAYLSDAGRAHRLFGYPRVPLGQVIRWTADWVRQGGRSLGKPTRFEVADGSY